MSFMWMNVDNSPNFNLSTNYAQSCTQSYPQADRYRREIIYENNLKEKYLIIFVTNKMVLDIGKLFKYHKKYGDVEKERVFVGFVI